MKKTKLFITLALVFMLLFSYVMPALAVEGDEELPVVEGISAAATAKKVTVDSTTLASYKANVTIETGNNGDTLKLFKIVDVTIAENNELTYEFTADFKAYIEAEGLSLTVDQYVNKDSEYHTNPNTLKELLGGFAAYTKKEEVTLNEQPLVVDGNDTFKVPAGQFVAVGAGNSKDALIYQTISIEVAPFIEDNEYKVYDNYQLNMKTSQPSISKVIESINGETPRKEDGYEDRKTADIKDSINYKLEINVPTYPDKATNTTFYVSDEADEGLTFLPDTLKVYGIAENSETEEELVGTQVMTITTEDMNGFIIDFTYSKIKEYSRILVRYDAELNENAVLGGEIGNCNNAKLAYSNAPFNGTTVTSPIDFGEDGKPGYALLDDTEEVYTYGMKILKINEEDLLLPGAEFEIYTNEECTGTPVKSDLVTSDEEGTSYGTIYVKGLAAGTYYVKETKAPAGYKLDSKVHTVVLGVNEDADEDGYVKLEVVNIAGGTLPSTGGMGTVIFTVVGIALAGGAALLLITKKRMSNNI